MTDPNRSDRGVWWSANSNDDRTGRVVIGIEQLVSASRVRLWLIDTRGLRIFDIRNNRMTGWSAPLSTDDPIGDFAIIRSLARGKLGRPANAGWPGPPLPTDDVNQLDSLDDLLSLLGRTWPDARVDPPGSTTGRRIQQMLGEGALSIEDLLQYGK